MVRILLVLVVLAAAGIGGVFFFANTLIRDAVVTYGPGAVNVPVALESVSLSPLDGSGSIKGLSLGQPESFGDDTMFSIGEISFDADVNTLMDDHVIFDTLVIDQAFISGKLKGTETNFQRFMKNLPATPETPTPEATDTGATDDGAPLTLTIRKLSFRSPTMRIVSEGLVDTDQEVALESFELTNLGTDEKGLSPSEIARHIMDSLEPQIARVLASSQFEGKLADLKNKAREGLNKSAGDLMNKLRKKK